MFIQFCYKNRNYLISKRNYLCDYSKMKSRKIDMTLSGKYLANYIDFDFDVSKFDKYPLQEDTEKLENTLKKQMNINREIIVGNGANGLLQNIIKILFINKGNLVVPFYTFDQAEYAVTSFKGYTKRAYVDNYKINFNKIKKAIDRRTRMVYICNPNNPTGIYTNSAELLKFAKEVKIPLVIDESGIEFTKKESILNYSDIPENLIVIRSFSKVYGMANFRIGYLVCGKKFKEKYLKNITTNEYSGISCILVENILLNSKKEINDNINQIIKERNQMIKSLKEINVDCILSDSNIVMTKTTFIESFLEELNKENVSVVPVYDEKKNLHIRVAIQDSKTNDEFLEIMKKILKNKDLIL